VRFIARLWVCGGWPHNLPCLARAPFIGVMLPLVGALAALRPVLLADTKTAEDLAEQIVGRERAGDLAERVVREAQFFGEEIERRIGLRRVRLRAGEVLAGADGVIRLRIVMARLIRPGTTPRGGG